MGIVRNARGEENMKATWILPISNIDFAMPKSSLSIDDLALLSKEMHEKR
jgi:hypothetical protein